MAVRKKLTIRPYARLLTMLGEQLIKNERVALIELIKNSYDADAKWTKVSFINFGKGYQTQGDSKIVIEDSGHGMTKEIIENHWLNPATPEKMRRKKILDTTESGRVIQGEKGIGRFAMLKLGRKIIITTRAKGENEEHIVEYDFSQYDDDFLTDQGEEKNLFIDDLSIFLSTQKPSKLNEKTVSLGSRSEKAPPHGTIIEISGLKAKFTEKRIDDIHRDISRMESIFYDDDAKVIPGRSPFEVFIYKDDHVQNYRAEYLEEFNRLLSEQAVIQIKNGFFNSETYDLSFSIKEPGKSNFARQNLNLRDTPLSGLKVFRDYFTYRDENNKSHNHLDERKIECGSFDYSFFVFDFDRNEKVPMKYRLDLEEKKVIRNHRVYLYRDEIRVYPYGEPEDDWLKTDAYRGTISAGDFLSNDQVVGYVKITNKGNKKLKDKTNREGLIEEGNATEDFVKVLQVFLAYIRQKPYARYRKDLESKKQQKSFKMDEIQADLNALKEVVGENKKARQLIRQTESKYKAERQYLVRRAETTEDLAGVGLSVETASHDIMGIMGKVFANLDGIIKDLMSNASINRDELIEELQSVRGGLGFIEAQLKDIQLLFKSSKQRRRPIRVKGIVTKVERIYKRFLNSESIELSVSSIGSPLIAKTTDAVLLQLLLNLFDNSIYWLQQSNLTEKNISIVLDGNNGQMVFADNGPGVDEEDKDYIFEPFYSGKGEEGRGLGLYIARQLLERSDYSIALAEHKSEHLLSGANFVINFIQEP